MSCQHRRECVSHTPFSPPLASPEYGLITQRDCLSPWRTLWSSIGSLFVLISRSCIPELESIVALSHHTGAEGAHTESTEAGGEVKDLVGDGVKVGGEVGEVEGLGYSCIVGNRNRSRPCSCLIFVL
jgi:hypothetical protein